MRILTIAGAIAAVAATPLIAQTNSNGFDPERMICKTQKSTGSRLSRQRICKTQADWDRTAQQASRELQEQMGNMPPQRGN